jgi:hypothetical protein
VIVRSIMKNFLCFCRDFYNFFEGTENSAESNSPFSTHEAFGSLLFFLRHICFPKFSLSRFLSNTDSKLEFLLAISPKEALKDDVENTFIINHVLPLIKKVQFCYTRVFITELLIASSNIIKI